MRSLDKGPRTDAHENGEWWADASGRVAKIYLYIVAWYCLTVILARYFKTWRELFWWPAVHGAMVMFTAIALSVVSRTHPTRTQAAAYCRTRIAPQLWRTMLCAAAMGVALALGAGPLDAVVVFIGAGLACFPDSDERIAPVLVAVAVVLATVLFALKKDALGEGVTVIAFEFFVSAVAVMMVRSGNNGLVHNQTKKNP